MTFGEYLKKIREEKNYTIKEMAEEFEWSRMYYARFEQDKLQPSKSNIDKFSTILKIEESEIYKLMENKVNAED